MHSSLINPNNSPRVDTDTDSWILDYVDITHMQSIIEAIDEDCSGFITVNEANQFALARPEGWRSVESFFRAAPLFMTRNLSIACWSGLYTGPQVNSPNALISMVFIECPQL